MSLPCPPIRLVLRLDASGIPWAVEWVCEIPEMLSPCRCKHAICAQPENIVAWCTPDMAVSEEGHGGNWKAGKAGKDTAREMGSGSKSSLPSC